MLWKNLFMILNIDTKYYDTKYYSGLLYTRKQNFSKESIFSLLPSSGVDQHGPVFFQVGTECQDTSPSQTKATQQLLGLTTSGTASTPTRPFPFAHGFSAGNEAPREKQQVRLLQPTGHFPNHA